LLHESQFHPGTVIRGTGLLLSLFMPRKKRESQTPITQALLSFREKRKWQIALRRYVLEKKPAFHYAPYFGLDIENIRRWFEMQFEEGIGWTDFAKKWQFDHIIPVTYFDFADQNELKMCWNFTNLRVQITKQNKDPGHRSDVLAAKSYFEKLYLQTSYRPCLNLLEKIDKLDMSGIVSTERQRDFILKHSRYLEMIENYSHFEFDLLNNGRTVEEVIKEVNFLKKF